jgi:hypothetical protein
MTLFDYNRLEWSEDEKPVACGPYSVLAVRGTHWALHGFVHSL